MAATRRKKRQYMGRVAICLGLLLKIVQIIGGAQLGINSLSSTWMTAATTGLLVGGFCVFAVERMNVTAVFSVICALGVLSSMLLSGDALVAFMLVTLSFISFSLMLISMKRQLRILSGIAILIITLLLAFQNFHVVCFSDLAVTVLLTGAYLIEGIGLFL